MPIMIIEVRNPSSEPRPENAGSEIDAPNKKDRCLTDIWQGQRAEYRINFEVAVSLKRYPR
jgi:hypothetical protein